MSWFALSCAGPGGHLGSCFIESSTEQEATRRAFELAPDECDEVLCFPVHPDDEHRIKRPNQLLSKEELEADDGEVAAEIWTEQWGE